MKNTDGSNRKVPAPLPSTVFAMNTTTAVTWKKRIITSITIVIIISTTTGNKIITMNIIIIINAINIPVVVNFLSQVIFIFLLFLGMVIYANEVETKEK